MDRTRVDSASGDPETLVSWTAQRHWDPAPQVVQPRLVEDTVLQMFLAALVRKGADEGRRAE